MHTEEEAITKWCPFARLQGTNCGTYNRPDSNQNCIASECMVWRQIEQQRETIRLYKDQIEVDGGLVVRAGNIRIIKGEEWRYEYTDTDKRGEFEYLHRAAPEDAPQNGYCGLAGKP